MFWAEIHPKIQISPKLFIFEQIIFDQKIFPTKTLIWFFNLIRNFPFSTKIFIFEQTFTFWPYFFVILRFLRMSDKCQRQPES